MEPQAHHSNPQSVGQSTKIRNAYTDAPNLHPNLALASLQLFSWLIFHPSAWLNHIASIDSNLQPDFYLAELRLEHWKNSSVRRLLLIGYIIWPIMIGVLISILLWISLMLGITSGHFFGRHALIGIVGGIAVGLSGGLAFSVAVGMAGGIAGGIALGMYSTANGLSGSVAIGTAIGVAGGIAVNFRRKSSLEDNYSLVRQINGLATAILSVSVIITLAINSTQVSEFLKAKDLAASISSIIATFVGGGLIIIIAIGLRLNQWRIAIVSGMMFSVIVGSIFIFTVAGAAIETKEVIAGSLGGVIIAIMFTLAFFLAEGISGRSMGILAGVLAGGGGLITFFVIVGSDPLWPSLFLSVLSILCGFAYRFWLPILLYPLYLIISILFYRADERQLYKSFNFLCWHSAFWDEHQRLRWYGLDGHVVLVAERDPVEGQAAIDYLSKGRQRWAAQAAQIELDARHLERGNDARVIRYMHRQLVIGELQGPASALLRSFSRMSQDVDAALGQESSYNQRLALSAVEDRLDGLIRELDRSDEKYATRFRPIAVLWRQAVADYIRQLATAIEERQEIDSPYIIGVPLTERQEIFVGREEIGKRIEQLLLDRRRPPLLLYGQRRMGKTSLLNNLGRLLPSTIVPLFVDLQGAPARASDFGGFLYTVAGEMVKSAAEKRSVALPRLERAALESDPFTVFDDWLNQVEISLGNQTALLMLDEFEALASALQRERYDEEDVLGLLRHLIQHRPKFKVLLAGSHSLAEYERWASYLINVQVVPISYLKPDEARQLVERPVKEFTLRYEPDARQRVLDLTRCHPFLVQLLCAEIVAYKNEQEPNVRRLATLADVEAAIPRAIQSGSFFFADIQRNQVNEAGQAMLQFIATRGEGGVVSGSDLAQRWPDTLEATLQLLKQRELIESVDDGYRFQVELIRRWFAEHR